MVYLIIIILVYLFICFIMFNFVCKVSYGKLFKRIDKIVEESLKPYEKEVKYGLDWFNNQIIERITIK